MTEKWKCTKDYHMSEESGGERVFTAGQTYVFTNAGSGDIMAIDDEGTIHYMDLVMDMPDHFERA